MELVYLYIGMSIFALIGIIALAIDFRRADGHNPSTSTTVAHIK